MQNLSDEEEKQVLGEVLHDKLQAILEYVQDVPQIKASVQRLETDMTDVKSRLDVIEVAVKDQSKELKDYKVRTDEQGQQLRALRRKAA